MARCWDGRTEPWAANRQASQRCKARVRPLASPPSIPLQCRNESGAMNDMKVFSGRANPELAVRMCDYLGLSLGRISIGNFPDGEISCKIDQDVRGRDIFIVQPTCPPVNETLMELLIMIDSFKRASAERITAVVPISAMLARPKGRRTRSDYRKTGGHMIARAGADRADNGFARPSDSGFFDIPVDHLFGANVSTLTSKTWA